MRPCEQCGEALGNEVKECPNCGQSSLKGGVANRAEPTPKASLPVDETRFEWLGYISFPLLAGGVFGGAVCLALGPIGILVGAGIFLLFLALKLVMDLL